MGRVKAEVNEETDRNILTILSMNGRVTLDFIGGKVGLSKHPTYRRIKMLEERYGIRYIPEIDVSKFGYFGYVVFVKFRNKVPSLGEILKALDAEPRVQLVLLTSGDYDLIIYFLSNNHRDVAYFTFKLFSGDTFAPYPSDWYITPHYTANFIPLRDKFFELLKTKIWRKTKNKKRPESEDLIEREFNVLRELNRNGAVNFTEIDAKYKQGIGASRYAYFKLKERGILKRVTISLNNLPIKYHSIFIINFFYGMKFSKTRPNLLSDIIKDGPIINKYTHIGEIGIPMGVMLVMPVFNDYEVNETEDYIEKKINGVAFKKLVVTRIPIGSFAYRRFDKTYTNQYRLLVEEYKTLKTQEKPDYENQQKPKKKTPYVMELTESNDNETT